MVRIGLVSPGAIASRVWEHGTRELTTYAFGLARHPLRNVECVKRFNAVTWKTVESVAGDSVLLDAFRIRLLKGGTGGELHYVTELGAYFKRFYIRAMLRCDKEFGIILRRSDNGNLYLLELDIVASTSDFEMYKRIAGSWTRIANEAIDLNADEFYELEFLVDTENGKLYGFRDGVLKFVVVDTAIGSFDQVGFRAWRINTYGDIYAPFIIGYE